MTERKLLPIILYKHNNKYLILLSVMCVLLVVVLYFSFPCNNVVKDLIIPFLLSCFSSLLLTILIDYHRINEENKRLTLIRNETLVRFFLTLSNYFARLVYYALQAQRLKGLTPNFKEKKYWYEWIHFSRDNGK